ncbi:MAG: EAL domain-containing protein [Burkholderiales bacterium]|nr:EAL domain-containing protein [Burkholderiales bacterium]
MADRPLDALANAATNARLGDLDRLRLLEAFLDHSSEAVFAIRVSDGRIVYANGAASLMYGYRPDEFTTLTVDQVSTAFDGVPMSERMRQYRERGRILFETTHRTRLGHLLPVEVSLSYVRSEHGDHTVGVVRSLEERQRLSADLEEAEQRWKIAIDATDRGVWDWQAADDSVFLSARCAGMLGFAERARSTPLGAWIDQAHPDDRAGLQAALLSQMRGESAAFVHDYRTLAADASHVWVQSRGRVVRRDASGKPLRMVGTLSDISERKRHHAELGHALDRLQRSEQVLRHAHAIAGIGSWVYDVASASFHGSADVAQLCGWRSEVVADFGQAFGAVHGDDQPSVEAAFAAALSGAACDIEYRVVDAAATVRWVKLRIDAVNPSVDAAAPQAPVSPTRLVGVVQDVSERKLAELVQQTRLAVLDRVLQARSADAAFLEITNRLEAVQTDWRVSIVLVEGAERRLRCAAAPSLPEWFRDVIDAQHARDGVGTCGSAVTSGEARFAADLTTDTDWAAFAAVVSKLGLLACWSIPFRDDTGTVRGSLAVYRGRAGLPSRAERELIEEFAHVAALAEARVRASEALRQAAAVFENTHDGVVVTDLTPRIVAVNRAYCDITGYSEAELLGQNPGLLKSGRHGSDFYGALWRRLRDEGHWQGELWNRRASGEVYPQWVTLSVVRDDAGQPSHYVGVCTDITQAKQSEVQLERLAHYDALTGLPNRLLAQSRLSHALDQAARQHGMLAVLFIDLDHFKTVNDSLGHPTGDELLAAFAARAQHRLRAGDTLARLGGDEFLLIIEQLARPGDAASVAQALLDTVKEPFTLASGLELYIGASVGVSLYPQDGRDVDSLIQHADSAMYQAKSQGRNTLRFYTEALTVQANERLALEAALRRAVGNDELELYYQPQLGRCGCDANPDTGVCCPGDRCAPGSAQLFGTEALVRWHHPTLGLVRPDRFIMLAEDTGLIHLIGDWVLGQACRQARSWAARGWPLVVAVNLSARQFQQRDLIDRVRKVLADTGLPARQLELEITESALIDQPELAIATLGELRALGVGLAIDDFGTGYSSLAYLKRLPVGRLKIDRSFVVDLARDPHDRAIVQAIVTMAHSLGMATLAEGVETAEQWASLRELGCDGLQGWLCSPALPLQQFEAALLAGTFQTEPKK